MCHCRWLHFNSRGDNWLYSFQSVLMCHPCLFVCSLFVCFFVLFVCFLFQWVCKYYHATLFIFLISLIPVSDLFFDSHWKNVSLCNEQCPAVRPCPKLNVGFISYTIVPIQIKLWMIITTMDLYTLIALLVTFDL